VKKNLIELSGIFLKLRNIPEMNLETLFTEVILSPNELALSTIIRTTLLEDLAALSIAFCPAMLCSKLLVSSSPGVSAKITETFYFPFKNEVSIPVMQDVQDTAWGLVAS
jgi:hypothetical protein